jgi:signal transduction histidine kinase
MNTADVRLTRRERELGAIINAYNEVTERLKRSHERLTAEVQRLREQLEEKNRELARRERLAALGQMAAGVAHEIRNPLQGIRLYASMLVKDLADREDACRHAGKIFAGARMLDGIVEDILAFAGQRKPNATDVALRAIVSDCMELAGPVLSAKGATLHVDSRMGDLNVFADPIQLQRALMNLIFNALDATSEDGSVWVSAERDASGRLCVLQVADDGPGIPDVLKERVFNPFFTTKDSGTGLGLAIVHRIAESHGGHVRVGDRPGGGAVVTIAMPVVRRPIE